MKIKLEKIVNSVEQLKGLQQETMPVKVSYRIKRLIDKLSPILKTYEEKRNDLVKEFGEENEDKSFQVKKENLDEFYKKLNEVLEIEEEVEFEPINIEELGDTKLKPVQIPDWLFI
jgi:single-stranded DNA-specific DHH superfamily exonuclease